MSYAALRTVTFQVTPAGITPDQPVEAGVQGEHNATRVVFALSEDFLDGAFCYRFEYEDGAGDCGGTGLLSPQDGQIACFLPLSWTKSGGIGQLRLVIAVPGDDGDEQTVYTAVARLVFAPREGGEATLTEAEPLLTTLLDKTEETRQEAVQLVTSKADKVLSPTAGHLAALDAAGNLTDSGIASTRIAAVEETAGQAMPQSGGTFTGTVQGVDPAQDADLATKGYVDSELAAFDFIKIVDSLPQTGLPNRLYLVPKTDPDTRDLFDEYVYADGDWEWLTTKQVEVDLSDYVTNTSYATSTVGGVIKINSKTYGTTLDGGKQLYVACATEAEIDALATRYKPIVPNNLRYAVKTALMSGDVWLLTEQRMIRERLTAEKAYEVTVQADNAPAAGVRPDFGEMDHREYRLMTPLTSLTVQAPFTQPLVNDRLDLRVIFRASSDGCTVQTETAVYFDGTDCAAGVFTPAAGVLYDVQLHWNGFSFSAVVHRA